MVHTSAANGEGLRDLEEALLLQVRYDRGTTAVQLVMLGEKATHAAPHTYMYASHALPAATRGRTGPSLPPPTEPQTPTLTSPVYPNPPPYPPCPPPPPGGGHGAVPQS